MLKTKEQVNPCTIELSIEVEPERVAGAIDDAYRQLAKRVAVPGFRKGKAPRAILERVIDEADVKDHAARNLAPDAFEEAVKEAEIEPYDLPELEVVQLEEGQPFLFKATVPLPPVVELGNYVGLKVERMPPVVSEEDIDRQIQEMRERVAKPEPVTDRPVQQGDYVGVELQRIVEEGEETPPPAQQIVHAGSNFPAFDEKLIGMWVDNEQTIEMAYPEDFDDKNLAGTNVKIHTKVLEIKERRIPEFDDEFAKLVGAESADQLRKTMRTRMEATAVEVADRQVESQIIFQIVENSKICFPDSMKEHEVSHRLQDLLKRLEEAKLELAGYLREIGKTFEELRADTETNVERDIKVQLALYEIAQREKLEVSPEDMEAEIDRMAAERKVPKASMKAYLDRTEEMTRVSSRLLRRKVLDFLVAASNTKNVDKKGVTK